MSRIVIVGAGVVGQSYGALLARGGHDIVMVARGESADHLHREGLRVLVDGELITARCEVTSRADATGDADAVILAVRGEQLASVLDQAQASTAPLVIGLTNPLAGMTHATQCIGSERMVWAFPGLGGAVHDRRVTAHLVRQQHTTVQADAPRSPQALELLGATGLPIDREPRIGDWFDTHNVFIAAMAAAILAHPDGAAHVAGDWAAATRLVRALRQGFDALQAQGTQIRPRPLRMIFGPVPTPLAAAYWKHQFSTPMVTVSMEPHARATRSTEMAAVFNHALTLVAGLAPEYTAFIAAAR